MTQSIFNQRYSRLCEALIRERLSASLTQADLAMRLGKPQSFVSKYERAERRLDVIEFLEVVEAIGADSCSLIREIAL